MLVRCWSPGSPAHVTAYKAMRRPVVLVTIDVEETRDGIEVLLAADGYRVHPARNEDDAVSRGCCRQPPDVILVGLGGHPFDVIASGARIRRRIGAGVHVPVVVFGSAVVDEGAEVAFGDNVYVTHPDNFDQLRSFLRRLLS